MAGRREMATTPIKPVTKRNPEFYKSIVRPEWVFMERLGPDEIRKVGAEFELWQHQDWMASRVKLVRAIQELLGWKTLLTPVWLVQKYGDAPCLYALETTQRTVFSNPRGRLSFFLQALGTLRAALRRGFSVPVCLALLRRAHKAGKLSAATMKTLMAVAEELAREKKEIQRSVAGILRSLPHEMRKLGARMEALKWASQEYKMPPEQVLVEAVLMNRLEAGPPDGRGRNGRSW